MSSASAPDRTPELVRPYALTDGRTRPAIELAIEALVTIAPAVGDHPIDSGYLQSGDIRGAIIELSEHRHSIAEIAALLNLPIGVARVLIADLVVSGALEILATLRGDASIDERRELIERTLHGLRAI
ncbi:DUF742 domain-containing protein [Rhodococcus qingshengii]|uniref:DUF742 domain-containing protein n=1 Tax=Rhodococcus qingshengii TaxID=334542 RepID=UPI00301B1C04